jgi:hypothetical protein
MEKRECACGRLYCEGFLITTDWAYWNRTKDKVTCPECLGIDVAAEMASVLLRMHPHRGRSCGG